VPSIGFPQSISVARNVLDPEDFRDQSFTAHRKTDVQHEACIASRSSSWHGFRHDGDVIAVETTRRSGSIRYR